MKFNDVLAHYQEKLLSEKDYRGFNGLKKLGKADGSMNVVAKKMNSSEPDPYYPLNISNNAKQQLLHIKKGAPGMVLAIPDKLAYELAGAYDISIADKKEKQLNSKGDISIGHNGTSYVLKKK